MDVQRVTIYLRFSHIGLQGEVCQNLIKSNKVGGVRSG